MRKSIRSEVEAIRPFDALERVQIAEALSWIDSGAELCRRERPATPPRHLVSYFAVIDGDWLLLVDHISARLWLPPGGHVEPEEHPAETVVREAQEELGLVADFAVPGPVFLTVTETVGATTGHVDVSLWYVLNGDRGATLSCDRSEFESTRWFHRSALPLDRTAPHLARFMAKRTSVMPR